MSEEKTPSIQIADARITLPDLSQQEQVVTTSPDLFLYDKQTNTVTVISSTPSPALEFEKEFNALAEKWRNETAFMSLASEQSSNFNYHQIIGMGRDVLPLIFKELPHSTSDWFWALRAITRDNVVVAPEDMGNVHKIAEAWLAWGKKHGYTT